MEQIEMIATYPGKPDFKRFTEIVNTLYCNNKLRLQQNDTINEQFLHKCIIAQHKGKTVARAALYLNPELKIDNQNVMLIGNYECIDQPEYAHQLFLYIENECRRLNIKIITGPMNGSTWDDYRFKTSQTPPYFLEPVHHLYYNEQFTENGFSTLAIYRSYIEELDEYVNLRHLKRESYFAENGIRIRNIDLNNYNTELKKLFEFSKKVFSNNYLYTSIDFKTFLAKYLKIKPFIVEDYVWIAENRKNEIAGFLFTVPDLLNAQTIVGKTVAARSGKQYAGIGGLLSAKLTQKARSDGYKKIIHAFIISNSLSANFSSVKAKKYSEYKLYTKSICY